jgi:hypothetical protein
MLVDNNGNNVESPVNEAFGLTYASFLVLPRLLMENMPWGWQKDMVDLIEQLNEKFDWEKPGGMSVVFKDKNGKFTETDRNLCDYRRGNSDIYLKDSGEKV